MSHEREWSAVLGNWFLNRDLPSDIRQLAGGTEGYFGQRSLERLPEFVGQVGEPTKSKSMS